MTDETSTVEGVILVRESLYHFLANAATQCEGMLFWIDALCINQENIIERNEQVSRMGSIYSHAECVRIWDLDIATELIEVLSGHDVAWDAVSNNIDILIQALTQNMSIIDLMSAAERLFGSTYFTRLWIIQEVMNANNLHFYCGSECFEWWRLELHSAVRALNIDLLQDQFDKLQRARKDFRAVGGFSHLDAAIEFSWDAECSEIRDKIYGVLSVTQGSDGFGVDYNEGCERLLIRALKHFSVPHISRFFELAHRMVQLLELDYQELYNYICESGLEQDFSLPAWLTVVWSPTTAKPLEVPAGVVCPRCSNTMTFDRTISRLPPRLFLWCPPTGYDQRSRPTHLIFRHMYREQMQISPHRPTQHAATNRSSVLLGWLSAPFRPLIKFLIRIFRAMNYAPAQTTTPPLPEPNPTEENSPEIELWRYLRCLGWKTSDSEAFDTKFWRLDTRGSGRDPYAIIQTNVDAKLFRGVHDASVVFSAAQTIRFIFFVKLVPFDNEGWLSNYVSGPPASMYQILNPDTRVHLQHRDSRVRLRTDLEDYQGSSNGLSDNPDLNAQGSSQHSEQSEGEEDIVKDYENIQERSYRV